MSALDQYTAEGRYRASTGVLTRDGVAAAVRDLAGMVGEVAHLEAQQRDLLFVKASPERNERVVSLGRGVQQVRANANAVLDLLDTGPQDAACSHGITACQHLVLMIADYGKTARRRAVEVLTTEAGL